jgi:glycosyltransferase involved in cell wall biosynthesis
MELSHAFARHPAGVEAVLAPTCALRRRPVVSIIMPARNAAAYVGEAISSMLHQTFDDFEFLIVDDASTDATVDVIRCFDDSRIHVFCNATRQGVAESLNVLLDKAQGDFIARMDADDISLPHRLETQVAFMREHEDIWACGGSHTVLVGGDAPTFVRNVPATHDEIKAALVFFNPIAHPFMMYRGDVWKKHAIRYSTAFPYAEDYELWIRLTHAYTEGRMANMQNILGKHRRHTSSVSVKHKDIQWGAAIKLQTRLIQDLGFSVFDKGIAVHATFFSKKQSVTNIEHLSSVFEWAWRLREANRQKKIYDEGALQRLLFEQLLRMTEESREFASDTYTLLAEWVS